MSSDLPPVNSDVLPGQRLCAITRDNHSCGPGTYEHQGHIHASLAGTLSVRRVESQSSDNKGKNGMSVLEISVVRERPCLVPAIGSVVITRVTAISARMAKCVVISVDGIKTPDSFKGIIRKEDVRATEKDKVEVHKSFQPRDIVVAKVISLGDASAYLLTTAENELGVVAAYSAQEEYPMIPVSWCEMQCPSTGQKELRKVAKPQPQYLHVKE